MAEKLTKYSRKSYFFSEKQALKKSIQHLEAFRFKEALREIYWWAYKDGWKWSPLMIREKHLSDNFDTKYGTDTKTRADLVQLDIVGDNQENGVYYQASPVYATRRILKKLNITNYNKFTFIDYGSGKGRTLLLASELPFKQVIGVEFARELHEIALRNIQKYKKKRASQTISINEDATSFTVPEDNLVLYFFNPFNELVLNRVLQNISQSLDKTPRSAFIIYRYIPDLDIVKPYGFHLKKKWWSYCIFERDRNIINPVEKKTTS